MTVRTGADEQFRTATGNIVKDVTTVRLWIKHRDQSCRCHLRIIKARQAVLSYTNKLNWNTLISWWAIGHQLLREIRRYYSCICRTLNSWKDRHMHRRILMDIKTTIPRHNKQNYFSNNFKISNKLSIVWITGQLANPFGSRSLKDVPFEHFP